MPNLENESFIDNIWSAVFTDLQVIGKFNKGIRFLLCITGIFSKYGGIIPLKEKKGNTSTNAFQKILDESNCKPNKIYVDKGSKFCNRSMKSSLQDNDIEMYSKYNEEKSVAAKTFIGILKNKLYKQTIWVSKKMFMLN